MQRLHVLTINEHTHVIILIKIHHRAPIFAIIHRLSDYCCVRNIETLQVNYRLTREDQEFKVMF